MQWFRYKDIKGSWCLGWDVVCCLGNIDVVDGGGVQWFCQWMKVFENTFNKIRASVHEGIKKAVEVGPVLHLFSAGLHLPQTCVTVRVPSLTHSRTEFSRFLMWRFPFVVILRYHWTQALLLLNKGMGVVPSKIGYPREER
jgi:hypothetical protein